MFGVCNFFSCGSYNPKAAFANDVKEGVKLPPLGGLCGSFLWKKELIDGHIQTYDEAIENLQAGVCPRFSIEAKYRGEMRICAASSLRVRPFRSLAALMACPKGVKLYF